MSNEKLIEALRLCGSSGDCRDCESRGKFVAGKLACYEHLMLYAAYALERDEANER